MLDLDQLLAEVEGRSPSKKPRPRSDASGAILFSGGLDSVALAILLKRKGHDLQPVYGSHRANVGNVTRKEVIAATALAPAVTGRPLWLVKPTKKSREAPWVQAVPQVIYTQRLPVSKARKPWRNRILIDTVVDLGFSTVALGVFGGERVPHDLRRADDVDPAALQRYLRKRKKRGRVLTLSDLGIPDKTALIKAVGRRGRNPEILYSSDSCLMYFNQHCGNCWSCRERAEAFIGAWGQDKTDYRPSSWAGRFVRRQR